MAGWTERNGTLREHIVSETNQDVFCITESHLVRDNVITVEGFKWFGNNRQGLHQRAPKGSGGVGIFIRNSLLTEYICRVVDNSYNGILGLQLPHRVQITNVSYFAAIYPLKLVIGAEIQFRFMHTC